MPRKPRVPKLAVIPTGGDELTELHKRQRALALASKKVTVAVRLPIETYKGLIEVAERTRAESLTWVINRALAEWLTTSAETDYSFFPGAIIPGSLKKSGAEFADPLKPIKERYAGQSRVVNEMRAQALQRQADEADTELQVAIRRGRIASDIAGPADPLDAPLPSHAPLPDQSDAPDLPPLSREEIDFMQSQGISPALIEPPPPNS